MVQIVESIDQHNIDPCLGEEPGQFTTGWTRPHHQDLALGLERFGGGALGERNQSFQTDRA